MARLRCTCRDPRSVRRFLRTGPAIVGLTASRPSCSALLALVSPLGAAESPAPRIGFLLALAAALRSAARHPAVDRRGAPAGVDRRAHQHGDRAPPDQRPVLAGAALLAAMAGFFVVDAVRYGSERVAGRPTRRHAGLAALAMLGNLAVALLLIVSGANGPSAWTVAVAVALRIFGIAWNIAVSPVHTAGRRRGDRRRRAGVRRQPARRRRWRRRSRPAKRRARRSIAAGSWRSSPRSSRFTSAAWAPIARSSGLLAPAVAVAGRHGHRLAHHAAGDQSALSALARADAVDRAAAVALVCRAGRRGRAALAATPGRRRGSGGACASPCGCARRATRFPRR